MLQNNSHFETYIQIFNLLKDIFLIVDAEYGTILNFNDAALKFYGYTREELLQNNIYNLCSRFELDFIKLQFSLSFEKDIFIECTQFDKEKKTILCNIRVQGMLVNNKKYLVLIIRDTRFEKSNTINYTTNINSFDDLEKNNKNFFMQQLDKSLSLSKRINRQCALLIIEIKLRENLDITDKINISNDLYKLIGLKIRGCLRKEDGVFSISNNEFAVIQTMVNDPKDATIVAQKIANILALPININENIVYLTSKIGISISSKPYSTATELVKNAYNSLYNIKLSGKSFFQIYGLHINSTNTLINTTNTLTELNKRNCVNINLPLNKNAYKAYRNF